MTKYVYIVALLLVMLPATFVPSAKADDCKHGTSEAVQSLSCACAGAKGAWLEGQEELRRREHELRNAESRYRKLPNNVTNFDRQLAESAHSWERGYAEGIVTALGYYCKFAAEQWVGGNLLGLPPLKND